MAIDPLDIEKTMRGAGGSAEPASLGDMRTIGGAAGVLAVIDRYEVREELGGGAFGCVYRAHDTVAGIDVAVKGLPPMVKQNREELDRIRENFALVQKLHHPHIASLQVLHAAASVDYRDEGARRGLRVFEGDYLVVMELARGVTLSQWRRQFPEGRVPMEQALEVCAQIAEALDYAHGERVVHRDIKPSNIMVESAGGRKSEGGGQRTEGECGLRVKVLDFGLAAEIRSSMSRVSREQGDTSGTRPYMAPEQWSGGRQDGRTDQYALAALFYELVSGAVPFAGVFETGDPVVMAHAVEHRAPEPLRELTKRQNAAVLRALAKGQAERFDSCADFVSGLKGGKPRNTRKTRKGIWSKGGLVALVVGLLAVLGAGAYLGYPRYQEYQARKMAEAEVAAQAAEQDAATRERIAELRQSVEAALASSNLQEAGRLLSELESVGGTTSVSSALRERYEALAGERETNRRYAEASVARDAVLGLDRGQTLGERLDRLKVIWREAEAARQGRAWGQALSAYDRVLEQSRLLRESDEARTAAARQRDAADATRRGAAGDNAATDAAELWGRGGEAFSRGAQSFESGEFGQAGESWKQAATVFSRARQRSLAVQAYRKAKSDYEAAFTRDKGLLESHGGTKWREVLRQARVGEASGGDPVEGRKAYEQALAGLPAAVTEAQQRDRAARIDAALMEARQAKQRERWQEVITAADRVLALDANNREAQTLKREAEGNLVPTWRIVATVGGREVPAMIKIGDQTLTAPHTFTLRDGQRYAAEVSYEAAGKRYRTEAVSVTADWKGARERRVVLEEQRGPIAGQNWVSAATGMEYVWIAQMNMWVGKYEVTNGEYRKKEPRHDSKDYKGNSLNGDRQPVVYVNFDDAKAYAAWLTERDKAQLGGMRYRVPSEQEFMTYAQCGDGREYPWGNNWPPRSGQAGNYSGQESAWRHKISGYNDGFPVTAPVEQLWTNPWGLYGVGGNVWEACASERSGGSFGAWRGASWNITYLDALRCATRYGNGGSARSYTYGFRLVLSR